MNRLGKNIYSTGMVLTFIVIVGCASPNKPIPLEEQSVYRSDPSYSYAKNVATAMGLQPHRMKDAKVSKKEYEEFTAPVGDTYEGGTSLVGLTAGAALEAGETTMGLDLGPAMALSILSSLSIPESPENHALYAGWVDKNDAKVLSPADVTKTITKVVERYISELKLETKPYLRKTSVATFEGVMIVGNEQCADNAAKTRCYIVSTRITDENSVNREPSGLYLGKMLTYKPDFVGSGEAYIYLGGIIDSITRSGINPGRIFDTLRMWREVSAELPEEFYLYIGPRKYTYTHFSGAISLGKSPVILNKGQVYYFVTVDDDKTANN